MTRVEVKTRPWRSAGLCGGVNDASYVLQDVVDVVRAAHVSYQACTAGQHHRLEFSSLHDGFDRLLP